MKSKITPEAAERCSRKSLREQLEDLRKSMQRESGSEDMQDTQWHLNQDTKDKPKE